MIALPPSPRQDPPQGRQQGQRKGRPERPSALLGVPWQPSSKAGTASAAPRPFFRPRQFILRDGDQVHGVFLAPWLQKSIAGLLAIGLIWASAASLGLWYQTQQADQAAEAFRNAIADLSRQQMRIADISKGLEGQRATLGRMLAEGAERRQQAGEGPQPLPALETEIAGCSAASGNWKARWTASAPAWTWPMPTVRPSPANERL